MDINDRMEWLDNVCNIFAEGKDIYNAISESIKELPGTEVIVSTANLGDTVFIATLSTAYKEKYRVKNLIIAAKRHQAEAVEWFEGVDGTIELEETEAMCLTYYFTISKKFYSNGIRYGGIPCYLDWDHPGVFFHLPPGFSGANLKNIWEERILDIPVNSPVCKMVVPEAIQIHSKEIYKNAVLIAPAAFTNKGIPDLFWEKLVTVIKNIGMKVYCNSGGLPYDKIIEGSTECVMSTKELILNAPHFKHVVAVRSGFTDLVSKTEARLTVLHLGKEDVKELSVAYGTRGDDVRDLGRVEGIYPLIYSGEKEDDIIRIIVENILNLKFQ